MQLDDLDLEARLPSLLHDLVDHEHAPAYLLDEARYHCASRRRARRRLYTAGVAVLGAAAALTLFAVTTPEEEAQVDVSDGGTSTSVERPPVTVAGVVITQPSTTTVAVAVAPVETAAPLPTAPPTTQLVCVDSTDPACGSLVWVPSPTNQPAVASLSASTLSSTVGQPVVFTFSWSDPDGGGDGPACSGMSRVGLDPGNQASPDVVEVNSCGPVANDCPVRYGPWTPPATEPIAETFTSEYAFTAPGRYLVTFSGRSPGHACDDLYQSDYTASIEIFVQ